MHVIHHLVIGGMENGLVNLINRLDESEFRHMVVCVEDHSSFADRIQRDDVEVIDLHRMRVGQSGVRRGIYRLCKKRRPALLHSRGLSGLDALLPATLAGVRRRVHGEHGWDMTNLDGSNRRALWLRRLHSPLVNQYVSVSEDLQRYLVNQVGIAARRISTICNGVDTVRFCPGLPAADMKLPPGFMDPGVVRFGTVGRLQPVKDQATLLLAAAELLRCRPELRNRFRLLLVGGGPLRDALGEQVQAQGLQDVTLITGPVDQVADWLRVLDVFVLPSLNEGISNTMLEAMASGVPALVTPVGGTVELLDDGVCGRSFSPGNVTLLAQHMADYMDDAALRIQHGLAARARVEQRFSLQVMLGRYAELYRRLAAH